MIIDAPLGASGRHLPTPFVTGLVDLTHILIAC